MPTTETLIAFTVAALLMNLSPGPSNLYVMARTLEQGISGGLAAVAGLAIGSLVHVVAAVFGLSAIFAYSPSAYTALKIVGALYLIYLGISTLCRNSGNELDIGQPERHSSKSWNKIFCESALVEITNPKTALFFIALLPQFVDPDAGPATPQFLVLGLIVTVSAIPCDLFVTLFTNKAASVIKENPSLPLWQDRVSGSILTGLGVYVLLGDFLATEANIASQSRLSPISR